MIFAGFRKGLGAIAAVAMMTLCMPGCAGAQSTPAVRQEAAPAEYVFVSLRVLSEQIEAAGGGKLSEDALSLGGIGAMEGFVVDTGSPPDLILYGLPAEGRPGLRLDDLVANHRAAVEGPQYYPLCSLDPRPEDIGNLNRVMAEETDDWKALLEKVRENVGPQMVVVDGVPRDSRHAHVMIDADYHMKKVSQGLLKVPGVASALDHILADAKAQVARGEEPTIPGAAMFRFWFHVADGYPKYEEADGVVALDGCPVVILVKQQGRTATGELVDIPGDDPHAMTFAKQLSDFLAGPSIEQVPVYADLENLYRLRAVLVAMNYRGAFGTVGWSPRSFLASYSYRESRPMPESLTGLANMEEWKGGFQRGDTTYRFTLAPIVCGGVGMDMEAEEESFSAIPAGEAAKARQAGMAARPAAGALTWRASIGG